MRSSCYMANLNSDFTHANHPTRANIRPHSVMSINELKYKDRYNDRIFGDEFREYDDEKDNDDDEKVINNTTTTTTTNTTTSSFINDKENKVNKKIKKYFYKSIYRENRIKIIDNVAYLQDKDNIKISTMVASSARHMALVVPKHIFGPNAKCLYDIPTNCQDIDIQAKNILIFHSLMSSLLGRTGGGRGYDGIENCFIVDTDQEASERILKLTKKKKFKKKNKNKKKKKSWKKRKWCY